MMRRVARLTRFSRRGIRPWSLTRSLSSLTSTNTTFLNGSNSVYMEEMYSKWQQDPSSVHSSWDTYFRTDSFITPGEAEVETTTTTQTITTTRAPAPAALSQGGGDSVSEIRLDDSIKAAMLARAFQVRGHFLAQIDPLNLMAVKKNTELDLSYYGWTENDLDRVIDVSSFAQKGLSSEKNMTIRKFHERLMDIYCGTIGYEYMHIAQKNKCDWIRENIEPREKRVLTKDEKLRYLRSVVRAHKFEHFLSSKWNTAKRFGLEGAESMVPSLEAVIIASAKQNVETFCIGMPHRGRLNVLANIVKKPLDEIFSDFHHTVVTNENSVEDKLSALLSGDVKYHLGQHGRTEEAGHPISVSLLPNPSHLEAVNPVVLGKTRSHQHLSGDLARKKHMAILLHGDAAFAGQGIVYETLGLSQLEGYAVGGTIHIVVNNQIGFTTDPHDSRSTPYCTDIAKAFNAPVFHVNGDDVAAVIEVSELAARYRDTFQTDVVIDLVCYRLHGHNELDEPSFTQPLMYDTIRKHETVLARYKQQLLEESGPEALTVEEVKSVEDTYSKRLEEAYELSKSDNRGVGKEIGGSWLTGKWEGMMPWYKDSPFQSTGVSMELLREVGQGLCRLPEGFNLHSRLKRVMKAKQTSIDQEEGLDWATGEALAFGTLLKEQVHVRFSGQDVQRGTFSHRHSVLHDQKTNATYTPLNNLSNKGEQASVTLVNSNLSEFAVLGFEYGFSLDSPHSLVIWEAQFGDFFNGAQVIIDNFISSAEVKWKKQSGLVMLLPHGYEGQGPEHSSARMERFLQMCSQAPDDTSNPSPLQQSNWQVANCTTPANYFHLLRRQQTRQFRKPLVVFSPKSLLRHPLARSSLVEMGPDTSFQEVIKDPKAELSNVRKVVFCSGKVYFDLVEEREKRNITDVALVRIEQLCPFPFQLATEAAGEYPDAQVVFCQEEHMNMGPWTYVEPRLKASLEKGGRQVLDIEYCGRAPAAAPATGSAKRHADELSQFLEQTFA